MTEGSTESDVPEGRYISISGDHMKAVFDHLAKHAQYMLQLPLVCAILAKFRMQEIDATKDMSFFKECERSDVHDCAMKHNYEGMLNLLAVERPWQLIWPLVSIDYIRANSSRLKVLSIGPRTESEILAIYSMGIEPTNVTAIDLMSYSPVIDTGDMHNMPYEDNSFDIIIAGWVLAYSSDNQKAADEMKRVARPGCHVAIGCVSEPHTREFINEGVIETAETCAGGVACTSPDNRFKGGTKTVSRFFNCGQILALFEAEIDQIIYRLEPHPSFSDVRSNVVAVFRMK